MNNNFLCDNTVKEINLIFYDLENIIKKYVEDMYNIKTRKRDITFVETLLCKIFYSVPSNTKTKITSSFNFDNNSSLTRQAFDYREKTIALHFYVDLYNIVHNLYKKLMKIDKKNNKKNNQNIKDKSINNIEINNKYSAISFKKSINKY